MQDVIITEIMWSTVIYNVVNSKAVACDPVWADV